MPELLETLSFKLEKMDAGQRRMYVKMVLALAPDVQLLKQDDVPTTGSRAAPDVAPGGGTVHFPGKKCLI